MAQWTLSDTRRGPLACCAHNFRTHLSLQLNANTWLACGRSVVTVTVDPLADFVPCFVAFEENVRPYADMAVMAMLALPVLCLRERVPVGQPLVKHVKPLSNLKSAATLSDVAKLLQFKPSALSYILFKQPAAAQSRKLEIPKRSGGTRTVKAPIDALKLLQRKLSVLLQDSADEINLTKHRKDLVAHGFKRKRSIISNARRHRNRRYVFNVDLQDFFPSINFGRVRGYFISDRNFALDVDVATVIAQIACDGNSLPQGSPCSPVISNLITHVLDMHLVRLASKVGCRLLRVCRRSDVFHQQESFPLKRGRGPSSADPHLWVPGTQVQRLIRYSGFRLNSSKTHMQYRTSRRKSHGLIVNSRINVRSEYQARDPERWSIIF